MHALSTDDCLKDSQAQRRTMVECQIRTFDVTDQRVIARFQEVPRELFLPDTVRNLAYSDIGFVVRAPSPDAESRYLLPPLVLARLIQGGRVKPTDRVLDVAPGLGYSTAILAGLARDVVALEADESLRVGLAARLEAYGLGAVRTRAGRLEDGAASDDPFDVILVNGTIETNPAALADQLVEGGRLLALKRGPADPTGRAAKAMCFEKSGRSLGGRFLFDASSPPLQAFREAPRFVF